MADPGVYLEKLSLFSRMLRLEGLTVGPKETEDAGRILIDLGLTDREQVKTALRTVYAKSREEQITFARVFDGFFISEEKMRQQAKEQMEREQELAKNRQQAEQELQLNGQPMDLDEGQREAYAAMPEDARQRLRSFTAILSTRFSPKPSWSSRCSWKTQGWAVRKPTRTSASSIGIFPTSKTRRFPRPSK